MGSFPRNLNEVYEKVRDFNRVEVYERVRISVVPKGPKGLTDAFCGCEKMSREKFVFLQFNRSQKKGCKVLN